MSTPYKCPVCGGRGAVPSDFYDLTPDFFQPIRTASTPSATCKTCAGEGIVWSPGSEMGSGAPVMAVGCVDDLAMEQASDDLGPENLSKNLTESLGLSRDEVESITDRMTEYLETGRGLTDLGKTLKEARLDHLMRPPEHLSHETYGAIVPESPYVPGSVPDSSPDSVIHMDKFDKDEPLIMRRARLTARGGGTTTRSPGNGVRYTTIKSSTTGRISE